MDYDINNLSTIFVFIYMLISPLLIKYGYEINQELFVSAMVAIVGLIGAIISAKNPNTMDALGNGPDDDNGAEWLQYHMGYRPRRRIFHYTYKWWDGRMTPEKKYECLHEELLQHHSLELAELEKEVEFKKEKIDNMQMKIDKMDEKIDQINENVNKIVLTSNKADNTLEQRLNTIETRLDMQDKAIKNNQQISRDKYQRLSIYIAIVMFILEMLTLYSNFIIK